MWPTTRPNIPGLDYHAGCRTAGGHGVDYLDYFEMDGGNLGIAIGEIADGDAIEEIRSPGALLLSSLHGLLRSLGPGGDDSVSDLVHSIHELFYEASPEGGYATLFVSRYDPIERRLDYCNAGHEAPVLLRKNGSRRRTILLDHGGPMVGVLRRSVFRQGSIRLQPGDVLAAYTSGLTDLANDQGEQWGYRRMLSSIENALNRPARDIVEDVLEEAHGFARGAAHTRDMTLWLGRIEEAMAGVPLLEAVVAEPETTVLAA